MVLASFPVKNKLEKAYFFQKTFLLVDISIGLVLNIVFLFFQNAKIQFGRKQLNQKSYIVAEALFTTTQIESIKKKEFAKAILEKNVEVFVVYVSSFCFSLTSIHLTRKLSISLLFIKKIMIPIKYSNFSNVFFKKKTLMLFELIKFNQHAIKQ